MKKVAREDVPELIGQFIDVFEDFLDEKEVRIPNDEKIEDATEDEEDSIANIYGTDYGNLSDDIESILIRWELIEKE